MIEVWVILFALIFIRNKFIQYYFESNSIFKYKQYTIKQIFKHWSIYPSLLLVIFYLYLEYTMFVQNYYFLPYSHIIKTATLLSYFPLIYKYKLLENQKYINNQFLSVLTSPTSKAGLFLWIGSSLNKIALFFNDNKMPTYPSVTFWTEYIKPDGFIDGVHIIGNAYSNAIPLCNVFDLGFTVLSLGDIVIRLFPYIILYYTIKRTNIKTLTK